MAAEVAGLAAFLPAGRFLLVSFFFVVTTQTASFCCPPGTPAVLFKGRRI
jgi:hypothetical protein